MSSQDHLWPIQYTLQYTGWIYSVCSVLQVLQVKGDSQPWPLSITHSLPLSIFRFFSLLSVFLLLAVSYVCLSVSVFLSLYHSIFLSFFLSLSICFNYPVSLSYPCFSPLLVLPGTKLNIYVYLFYFLKSLFLPLLVFYLEPCIFCLFIILLFCA